MKSHLDTECPCYCPYCDITAEREVICGEHKEKCHKFPLTSPNNIGVDNILCDKFDNINELQNKTFSKINEMFDPKILIELQNSINIVREEATQSLQIAKECSEKIDKQNDSAIFSKLYNIRSYLTTAVLTIAILIALLIQSQTNYSLEEYKQNSTELQQQIILLQEALNKTVANHQHCRHQLSSLVWSTNFLLTSELSSQLAPVIVKMSTFAKKVRDKEEWYSTPFFAFEKGYQMCLKVYAAGHDEGEGTHVSVYLHLMVGLYDDELHESGHWPLRGTFTIELLNQLNDSDHYNRIVQFHPYLCHKCTNRVLYGKATGWGYHQFISHDTLLHHSNNIYHKNDFLIFRISRISHHEDMKTPYEVAPVVVRVTKLSCWLKSQADWYSSLFFAFKKGYQMCLRVSAAGDGEGKGTHVSVYLQLIRGPHDYTLEQSGYWPLKGTFTIELLNQLNDNDHYNPTATHIPTKSSKRLYADDKVTVGAVLKFISHDTLFQHNGYLKNDTLQFRISYLPNSSGNKGN